MTPVSPTFACKLLALLSTCVALVATGIAGCSTKSDPVEGHAKPKVTVVEAQRQTVPIIVTPIGTTRALEDVTIRARVKGFLTQKHFQDGGPVKKDQLLLVIDEIPFKIAVEQAKANLDSAHAAVNKAKASKTREVNKAQLALDQAQLLLDQVEERRARNLLQRRAASQEDYDKADAQRKKTEAQVQGDEAKVDEANYDYQIDIDRAKADLESARAVLENAKLDLGYCRMVSPINGRIGELKVKLGNMVGEAGQTELVNIQQLDPMGLDLRPAARYLPIANALQKDGLQIELAVEGGPKHPHLGKTIFIDNTVDATTSTFLLRAEVPNPDNSLLPGQYIKASMIVGKFVDAIVVPEQCVVEGQEGSRVYVVTAEGKVQVAKVAPVDVYQGLRVLESGLEPGQRVIVQGVQLVCQGQEVNAELATFDKFVRPDSTNENVDQRFNSRITRVPGLDPLPGPSPPPTPPANAQPEKIPSAAPAPKAGA